MFALRLKFTLCACSVSCSFRLCLIPCALPGASFWFLRLSSCACLLGSDCFGLCRSVLVRWFLIRGAVVAVVSVMLVWFVGPPLLVCLSCLLARAGSDCYYWLGSFDFVVRVFVLRCYLVPMGSSCLCCDNIWVERVEMIQDRRRMLFWVLMLLFIEMFGLFVQCCCVYLNDKFLMSSVRLLLLSSTSRGRSIRLSSFMTSLMNIGQWASLALWPGRLQLVQKRVLDLHSLLECPLLPHWAQAFPWQLWLGPMK